MMYVLPSPTGPHRERTRQAAFGPAPGGQPIRTLVVDDEPLAREHLRLRLQPEAAFEIVAEAGNGRQALAAIERYEPEVVFLDIQMPDISGFDVIAACPAPLVPWIVFVTAYDQFALDAFRVHALDYLLKPFDDERFQEALALCRAQVTQQRRECSEEAGRVTAPLFQLSSPHRAPDPLADRLVIKTRGRVLLLKVADIDWVEACGDYAKLHVGARSYLLRRTMRQMDQRLGAAGFLRISRSAIVNLERVDDLCPLCRGEYLVRLTDGREIKLTRTYRAELEARLGDRL